MSYLTKDAVDYAIMMMPENYSHEMNRWLKDCHAISIRKQTICSRFVICVSDWPLMVLHGGERTWVPMTMETLSMRCPRTWWNQRRTR